MATKKPASKKGSKKKPAAKGKAAGLRVRMYRVGFGDFFLLTVPSKGGPQHILIDCGVTPGKTHKGDIGTIKDAVADMAKETGNKLALIIMTHRHQDHIIGFSRSADIFAKISVDAVWMPFWESEYDDGAKKTQAKLTEIASDVQQHLALAAGTDPQIDEMLAMLQNATGEDHLTFAAAAAGGAGAKKGTGGGTNKASLQILKNFKNAKPQYYKKGDVAKLPPGLVAAGLTAEILGPPPEETLSTFMKLTDLKKDVGQYLGANGSDGGGDGKKFSPFAEFWQTGADAYPRSAFEEWGPRPKGKDDAKHNRELEDAVKAAQPDMLLTAVKTLDAFLNNQSLVVLFTFKGKKLLFVGDAQAGNWEYWMYGGEPDRAPSIDKITPEGKSILGNLDFYKVGHHGSTNATPITAVEAMGGNFAAMCSTQEDSFGSKANKSEVPREPLLDALGKKSKLVRSDQIAVKAGGGVPAAKGAPKVIPKIYKVGPIYIDYFL